jgi:hypothetical protein
MQLKGGHLQPQRFNPSISGECVIDASRRAKLYSDRVSTGWAGDLEHNPLIWLGGDTCGRRIMMRVVRCISLTLKINVGNSISTTVARLGLSPNKAPLMPGREFFLFWNADRVSYQGTQLSLELMHDS